MEKLGCLLPKRQANLLTDKVKNYTQKELEKQINAHPKSDLSYKDLAGLKELVVRRINKGQSMYTWEKYNFRTGNSKQGASTCICF